MSFTVRLITDDGPVEYRNNVDLIAEMADGTLMIGLPEGTSDRHPWASIRHIDVFWTAP